MSFLTPLRLLSGLRVFPALALLVAGATLSACNVSGSDDPEIDPNLSLRAQLQIVADQAVESGLPGVSLHVQTPSESVSVVAGVANQASKELVTPTSLFHVASVGKPFTATLILRLVQAGKLALEDPIDRWLDPALSAMIRDSDTITVKMLLGNTSGIPDYFNEADFLPAFEAEPGKRWTTIELVGFIGGLEHHFAPGTEYRYSNTNFLLLGEIAHRVTGRPFEQALRDWVLDPAGLEHTFGVFETVGQPASVRSYIPENAFEENSSEEPPSGPDTDTTTWINSVGHGNSPIHSTPADLSTFLRTLVDTDSLVSGEIKQMMLTESVPGVSEYGLGIEVSPEERSFGHSGRLYGNLSLMFYLPSRGTSFATVTNGAFGVYDARFGAHVDLLQTVVERYVTKQERTRSEEDAHAVYPASLPATSSLNRGGRFGACKFHW